MLLNACTGCGMQVTAGSLCRECGTPAPVASGGAASGPWEAILEKLRVAVAPRYEVRSILAYGGMAGVYLADEPRLARSVAIKVMAPGLMLDPSLVERFEQEARTIAQFTHPNIITIYEVDQRAELHYFVMSYVPGRTLGQVMAESAQPLPVDVVRAWLYQIGDALAYAHEHGVVHRDVKPGNVLLDARGNAIVTDFGIAKVADADTAFTRTGMLVGTPAYMSPEQCTSGRITDASDQYSLGAMLYQMLSGQTPFAGPTLSVLQAHVTSPPPPLQQRRPDCPVELLNAVARMLEKRPADRWPSISSAISAAGARAPVMEDPVRETLRELAMNAATIRIGAWLESVREGSRERMDVQVLGPRGQVLANRRVHWHTSDAVLASVVDDVLLATRPGNVLLQASSGSATLALPLTVEPDPVRSVEIVVPQPSILAGTRIMATALVRDLDGSSLDGRAVLWNSADPEIARVSADGMIHGIGPGEAIITANTGGRSAAVELVVTAALTSSDTTASPDPGSAATGTGAGHATPPAIAGGRTDADTRGSTPAGTGPGLSSVALLPAAQAPPPASTSRGGVPTGPAIAAGTSSAVSPMDDGPVERDGVTRRARGPILLGLAALVAIVVTGVVIGMPADGSKLDGADSSQVGAAVDRAAQPPEPVDVESSSPVGTEPEPDTDTPLVETNSASGDGDRGARPPASEIRPAAPNTGTIEIVGSLPGGTAIRVRGADGQVITMPGRAVSLAPGHYDIEFTLAGWEILAQSVQLRAGDTTRVRPAARQLPVVIPPTTAPTRAPTSAPAPDRSAERAAVLGRVQEYVAAIARRDATTVLPVIPAAERAGWRAMLTESSITDFRASAESMDIISLTDSEATIELRLHLSFRSFNNLRQNTQTYLVTVAGGGSGWRVADFSLKR